MLIISLKSRDRLKTVIVNSFSLIFDKKIQATCFTGNSEALEIHLDDSSEKFVLKIDSFTTVI